jgi:hypothetical protein
MNRPDEFDTRIGWIFIAGFVVILAAFGYSVWKTLWPHFHG